MIGARDTAVGTAEVAELAGRVVSPAVHRAHLDGMRALAVYLVVAFHAGIYRFAGGYVGVDIFFVLSGYLVTQVLVRDVAGEGSIRLGRFYARRVRRLLPAAFVALIGTALLITALDPAEALAAIDAFKAAFLYSANWYFIGQSTDYFAAEVVSNPVLPFWSLAVEEQFYVIWPLTLAALFWVAVRLPKHRLLFVRLVVAGGALASMVWALTLRTDEPNRAYFGTDARAYQLLAGASIALLPSLVDRAGRFRRLVRFAAPASLVAIVAVGSSFGTDDPILRGVAITVVTVVAIVALEAAEGGIAQRALSSRPLVYLGKVSYGTYLWHWPVIIVAAEVLDLGEKGTLVLAVVVATGLASLSYQLLEDPVRTSRLLDRHRLAVIGVGLAVSVIAALVLIPAIIEPRDRTAVAQASPTDGFTPVPDWVDVAKIRKDRYGQVFGPDGKELSCVGRDPAECTIVRGSGKHILIMGDSNAVMMIPAFTQLAQDHDLSLSLGALSGCSWQRDVYTFTDEVNAACREIKDDAYDRVIPALDPDVIVLVNLGDSQYFSKADPNTRAVTPGVEASTRSSLEELAVDGRGVVVIEPLPRPTDDQNPLSCLSVAEVVEDCRFVAATGPSKFESLLRSIAASNPRVRSADVDQLVCPYFPICDPIVNGLVVRWDFQHLTRDYSRSLSEPLGSYLRDQGLL